MLIIGPPGVGKSEQAKRIADYYDQFAAPRQRLSWAVAGKAFADAITDAREVETAVPSKIIARALGERLACPDIKHSVA